MIVVPGEVVNIADVRDYYVTNEIDLPASDNEGRYLVGLKGDTADGLLRPANTIGLVVLPDNTQAEATFGRVLRQALKHQHPPKASRRAGQ